MFEEVDWSHRGAYMAVRHGISVREADEALNDPDRAVIHPDYNSTSGRATRVVGYSETAGALLSIIVLAREGTEYGVNGWRANAKDEAIYYEQEAY